MKQKLLICLLTLSLVLVMAGCGCEHVWTEADCVNPNTCSECGETEGAPLGHTWKAATCTDAKTCEICGATEGEAKGHSWVEATCTDAKTCSECKLTEGEALGHTWQDATTEAPKTCTTCAATEGERIITDERFTSASAAPILGKWSGEIEMSGEEIGTDGLVDSLAVVIDFTFGPAGDMKMEMALKDPDAFNAAMLKAMEDELYVTFANQGLGKEAADDAMKATYGMTVSEYAAYYVAALDLPGMFELMGIEGVYYVQDGKIYIGLDWEDAMEPSAFTVEGDVLSIEDMMGDGETVALNRVVEE